MDLQLSKGGRVPRLQAPPAPPPHANEFEPRDRAGEARVLGVRGEASVAPRRPCPHPTEHMFAPARCDWPFIEALRFAREKESDASPDGIQFELDSAAPLE
jgi:hypothetical protein